LHAFTIIGLSCRLFISIIRVEDDFFRQAGGRKVPVKNTADRQSHKANVLIYVIK
jgi:hypothetical protein